MFALALRSLRFRTGDFVASFISVFLGATILMAFASLLDTGFADGVPSATRSTLTIMASVVGGWGLLLVVFAVTSTLTLSVRRRATEMALLKSVGATPAQLGRMIIGESAVVALAAAVLAIPPAFLAGWSLLKMLASTHQVPDSVGYRFGVFALAIGLGITFVAATAAAVITARRTGRMRVTESLMDAAVEPSSMSRKRIVTALVFLAGGLNLGIVTATVMHGKGTDAMQTAGSASILFAIGLALLGPVLLRRAVAVVAVLLERVAGVSGYLTVHNLRERSNQMSAALMPIILFVGISTGTLYMQSTDNAAVAASGIAKTADQKSVEILNFVVIGMIVLFAAVLLINTLISATVYRRREFGQQRLIGSTPGDVLRMLTVEDLMLTAIGVLFGTVASIVTIVPFSIARTNSVLPDGSIGIYLGVVVLAATLTLAAGLGTARRTLRVPAVEAVA
jgi:predicted lysophospholipase L1 biosynthesis ABC-type transport system permease subunit